MLKMEIREQVTNLAKIAQKNGVTLQEMQGMVANAYESELCVESEQFTRVHEIGEKSIKVAQAALRILQECEELKRRLPRDFSWQEKFVVILAIYYEETQKRPNRKYYSMFCKRAESKLGMTHAEFQLFLREKFRYPLMRYVEILRKSRGFYWCGNVRSQDVFEAFYHDVMEKLI